MNQRTIETWRTAFEHNDTKSHGVKQRVVVHENDETENIELAYEFDKHDVIDQHDPLFVEERVFSIAPPLGMRDENDDKLHEGDTVVLSTWTESPYGNPSKHVEHRMQLVVIEDNVPDGVVLEVQHQRAGPVREHEFGEWTTGEFETIESTEVVVGEPRDNDIDMETEQSMSGAGPETNTTVGGNPTDSLEEKFPSTLR